MKKSFLLSCFIFTSLLGFDGEINIEVIETDAQIQAIIEGSESIDKLCEVVTNLCASEQQELKELGAQILFQLADESTSYFETSAPSVLSSLICEEIHHNLLENLADKCSDDRSRKLFSLLIYDSLIAQKTAAIYTSDYTEKEIQFLPLLVNQEAFVSHLKASDILLNIIFSGEYDDQSAAKTLGIEYNEYDKHRVLIECFEKILYHPEFSMTPLTDGGKSLYELLEEYLLKLRSLHSLCLKTTNKIAENISRIDDTQLLLTSLTILQRLVTSGYDCRTELKVFEHKLQVAGIEVISSPFSSLS